jgi:hypothetical protein
MPTAAEILKTAGLDDATIAALDAKAITAFETMMTTAERERQQAEIEHRAAIQLYDEKISPALNTWGNNEANLTAERDYYKTLAAKAKDGGFIAEVPPFQPANGASRGPDGKFVPGANPVPGSPSFQEIENKVGNALGTLADLQWKYRSLYGKEMPDSPTALAAEAAAQRLSLIDHAAKKYNFAGKEQELKAAEQKAHDDAIRKEERESVERKYAEAGGANPNVRQAQVSRFAEIRKGVQEGTRPDPLKLTPDQRHAATTAAIRQEISQTVQ